MALIALNDNGTRSVLFWKSVILMGMTVTYKFFNFFGPCNLVFLCLPERKLQTSNWLDVLLQDLLG